MGEGELELCLPSPIFGRGAGGEGKDLSLHWDAPHPHSPINLKTVVAKYALDKLKIEIAGNSHPAFSSSSPLG
jgi:hypothetical protein